MSFSDFIDYNPETGIAIWKKRTSNRIVVGRQVGSLAKTGYLETQVNGVRILVHRMVWELMNGEIPLGYQIDHINGVRTDNRLSNLRVVSPSGNSMNSAMRSNNTSGHVGVCWAAKDNAWLARIGVCGREVFLGNFKNLDDAVKARKEAEIIYGYHKNHGRKNANNNRFDSV